MKENQIDNILNPQRKLIALFFTYLFIAICFIAVVLYGKFINNKEESKEVENLYDIVSSTNDVEGKSIKLEVDTLPIFLGINENDYFYYLKGLDKRIYIVSLTNETFKNMLQMYNNETGFLNENYEIKGVINNIDESIKKLALENSSKVFESANLNSNNFSDYLGSIYIQEKNSVVSGRMVTVYTCFALFSLFFFILAFCYILPCIIKVRKVKKDKELIEILKNELSDLTETPYKKQHVYFTRNYVIFRMHAIKYQDIEWAYILIQSICGIKSGENLIVQTKDNKKYTIASVGPKSSILDNILLLFRL